MAPKLKDFRKEFKFSINRNLSEMRVKYLLENKFDFNVFLPSIGINLQRDFVWDLHQKQELIMSIIKDTYIHKVTLIKHYLSNKDRDFIIEVIDGKQRINTFIEFIKNNFSINLFGVIYYYCNLPDEIKMAIDRYYIVADVCYSYYDNPISDKDKIDLFCLINFAGTLQDKDHMDKLLTNQ